MHFLMRTTPNPSSTLRKLCNGKPINHLIMFGCKKQRIASFISRTHVFKKQYDIVDPLPCTGPPRIAQQNIIVLEVERCSNLLTRGRTKVKGICVKARRNHRNVSPTSLLEKVCT